MLTPQATEEATSAASVHSRTLIVAKTQIDVEFHRLDAIVRSRRGPRRRLHRRVTTG